MCLILFSYKKHDKYKLILAANRDEFYSRPTEPVSRWNDGSGIIAGKDLEAGGTWMGVTENGRFSALTNYRNPRAIKSEVLSRGLLVSEFLKKGSAPPEKYLEDVAKQKEMYNGFNLLAGDKEDLYYFSNMEGRIRKVQPGVYGLSNHLLDTPWPKTENGKAGLQRIIDSDELENPGAYFSMLSDSTTPPDHLLPDTGMGLDWERILGPVFIKSEIYGTRSSSLLLVDYSGRCVFAEKTWSKSKGGEITGSMRVFEIKG